MYKFLALTAVTYTNALPESCFLSSQIVGIEAAENTASDMDWLTANYDTSYKLREILSCTSQGSLVGL